MVQEGYPVQFLSEFLGSRVELARKGEWGCLEELVITLFLGGAQGTEFLWLKHSQLLERWAVLLYRCAKSQFK